MNQSRRRSSLLLRVLVAAVVLGATLGVAGSKAEAVESKPCRIGSHRPQRNCSTTTTVSSTSTTAASTTSTTAASTTSTTAATTTSTTAATTSTTAPSTTTACSGVNVSPSSNLQSLIDANAGNTTFCFAPGTYRMTSSVIPKTGNVFWGSPGAIINGSRVVSAFGRSGSYWTLTGQTQQFPVTAHVCEPATYTGCRHPESVFVNDKALFQVTSLSELSTGEFYFDYGADTIYLFDDPTGKKVETSVAPAAIRGYGGSTGQQNVTVRGLIFEKFAASTDNFQLGAVKSGWNWRIEGNEFRLNHAAGVLVNSGGVLRNNKIHHNGQYGFNVGPADNVLIEGNEVSYNNTAYFTQNDDAGGSKIMRSSNVTIRDNWVHDNNGPGLWTDWENVNVLYENNTAERNRGAGIFHEASADAIIRNNTLEGNSTLAIGKSLWHGADLYLNDSKNTEIYGNTIHAGQHGIGMVDADRGSTSLGLLEVRNVYVHHNTITMPAGGSSGMVGDRSTAFTSANNRWDYNRYFTPSSSAPAWQWSAAQTWAQWQAGGKDLFGSLLTWAQ